MIITQKMVKFKNAPIVKCLPVVPSPHGEMDIIFGFEPKVGSSNLPEGTSEAGGDIIFGFEPKVGSSNLPRGTLRYSSV